MSDSSDNPALSGSAFASYGFSFGAGPLVGIGIANEVQVSLDPKNPKLDQGWEVQGVILGGSLAQLVIL